MSAWPADSARTVLGYGMIAAATLAAFWPTLHAGFVWNDDSFLTANPLIKAPDGLYRFWLTGQAPDYWPLTSTSLWLEWRLWGMHASGYHATNLLLHLLCTALLWRTLRRLAIPGALFGAILFAVHPVNVESVAWITQRKNLLAMLGFLSSIYCFARFEGSLGRIHAVDRANLDPPTAWLRHGRAQRPGGAGEPRSRPGILRSYGVWYVLSLIAFLLAMLSKASVAPLPIVLLGMIWWRRRLVMRDGIRLAPYALAAAALAAVNLWFQVHSAGTVARPIGPLERLLSASGFVWFYLGKALLPIHLSFFYPRWSLQTESALGWIALLGVVAFAALLWRISRAGFFSWAYFVLMLAPALGFTDVYYMRYSPVADHYQHLALIAVTTSVGAALWHFAKSRTRFALGSTAIGCAIVLTFRQCVLYRDSETLYRATLAQNPNSALAHNNLGNLLLDAGKNDEAMGHFEEAVRLDPIFSEAQNDLGAALVARGHLPEAIGRFRSALAERPNFAEAHYNLGLALRDSGNKSEALEEFRKSVQLWPTYIKALNALGLALYDSGRPREAAACYQQALKVDPNYPDILNNLGCAFLRLGRLDEAIANFQQGIRLGSKLPDLPYNLGVAFARAGRLNDAIVQFEATLKLDPSNADARLKLSAVLWQAGRRQEALAQREEAGRTRGANEH